MASNTMLPVEQKGVQDSNKAMTEDIPITFKDRIGPVRYMLARLAMIPHYHVFEKTTYRPIKRILRSRTPAEAQKHVLEWCKRKNNETNYVQVAGAVLFASVVSCLGWQTISDAHWLAPAAFYVCLMLSLASIFTAAQQSIVLPDRDTADSFDLEQIELLKLSLARPGDDEPALLTLFAWQCPIMLLGYSVVFFMIGLFTFVVSPLAFSPGWGSSAKTVIMFLVIMISIGISATVTTPRVYKFRV